MGNHLNNIIFGLINQPQVWIKQEEIEINNFLNYVLFGIINQPQIRIEHSGVKMTTEITPTEVDKEDKEDKEVNVRVQGGSSGAVYGLGIIGASIYYISHAITPQEKALGFLKALVWPVFLVKEVLEFLHKE
jgi:hypothetical protein